MNEPHLNRLRTRWAAIGAAVAVTLGAGGIGIVNADDTDPPVDVAAEDVNLGDLPVFRPINPCRLADTRPGVAQQGNRNTPLGPQQRDILIVHGTNGDCPGIPDDVTAVMLNVTALNATEPGYLSLAPGVAPSPETSNLNFVPGQPPTPNAVAVGVDDDGRFNVYNSHGNIDYIVDVVGLFRNHNHNLSYLSVNSYNAVKPKAAYAGGPDGVGNIGTTARSVRSVAINAPVAGTLVASAEMGISYSGGATQATCSIGTSVAIDSSSSQVTNTDQLGVVRQIPVSAGDHTVHLVCIKSSVAGTITTQRPQLSVLFVAS